MKCIKMAMMVLSACSIFWSLGARAEFVVVTSEWVEDVAPCPENSAPSVSTLSSENGTYVELVFETCGHRKYSGTAGEGETYDLIVVPAMGAVGENIGEPALPTLIATLSIDDDFDPEIIDFVECDIVSLTMDNAIVPDQLEVPDGDPEPPFEMDSDVYAENWFHPIEQAWVEEISFEGDQKKMSFGFMAGRYNPVTGDYEFATKLRFRIWDAGAGPSTDVFAACEEGMPEPDEPGDTDSTGEDGSGLTAPAADDGCNCSTTGRERSSLLSLSSGLF